MAESISDLESDASSVESCSAELRGSQNNNINLRKRLGSLQQENRVLRMELDTFRFKCRSLEDENKELKKARVTIQLMAEQQEEYISNTLLKKIQALKNEKEQLARNYEQEEEFLTNDLSRKLYQLRQEKCELEVTLEKEQEYQVNKLMRKIEKLQADVVNKQANLEQLKKDKVELENQLEQEQEALVNKLWKRMDKLETEKRLLQQKLDQPISAPSSPRDAHNLVVNSTTAENLSQNIQFLKEEVSRLQNLLKTAQSEHKEKIVQFAEEERQIKEENLRLQRKLQMEIERREQLCRHLSEGESSLEMDDERHFNEMTKHQELMLMKTGAGRGKSGSWGKASSSPVPISQTPTHPNTASIIPIAPSCSPGLLLQSPLRCTALPPSSSALSSLYFNKNQPVTPQNDKFAKPSGPAPRASGDEMDCSGEKWDL